jgi:hypothetical protein
MPAARLYKLVLDRLQPDVDVGDANHLRRSEHLGHKFEGRHPFSNVLSRPPFGTAELGNVPIVKGEVGGTRIELPIRAVAGEGVNLP